jgi:hypothetical protein
MILPKTAAAAAAAVLEGLILVDITHPLGQANAHVGLLLLLWRETAGFSRLSSGSGIPLVVFLCVDALSRNVDALSRNVDALSHGQCHCGRSGHVYM